jgi:hypothetical protein
MRKYKYVELKMVELGKVRYLGNEVESRGVLKVKC